MSTEETPVKPPTISQNTRAIREMVEQLHARAEKADRPTTTAAEKPRLVAEAVALEQCIRALDAMVQAERDASHSTSMGFTLGMSGTSADRILRYLAAKYGVYLVETQVEPCSRPHIDALDDSTIGQAVRQAVQP